MLTWFVVEYIYVFCASDLSTYVVWQIKVESAVKDIISDELQKLKQHGDGKADQEADMIWEYQGPQTAKPVETESEDILLEMERLLYKDMRDEAIQIGTFSKCFFIATVLKNCSCNLLCSCFLWSFYKFISNSLQLNR